MPPSPLGLSHAVGRRRPNRTEDVARLGRAFARLGYLIDEDRPEAAWRPEDIAEALGRFQRAEGLTADGYAEPGGESEWRLLERLGEQEALGQLAAARGALMPDEQTPSDRRGLAGLSWSEHLRLLAEAGFDYEPDRLGRLGQGVWRDRAGRVLTSGELDAALLAIMSNSSGERALARSATPPSQLVAQGKRPSPGRASKPRSLLTFVNSPQSQNAQGEIWIPVPRPPFEHMNWTTKEVQERNIRALQQLQRGFDNIVDQAGPLLRQIPTKYGIIEMPPPLPGREPHPSEPTISPGPPSDPEPDEPLSGQPAAPLPLEPEQILALPEEVLRELLGPLFASRGDAYTQRGNAIVMEEFKKLLVEYVPDEERRKQLEHVAGSSEWGVGKELKERVVGDATRGGYSIPDMSVHDEGRLVTIETKDGEIKKVPTPMPMITGRVLKDGETPIASERRQLDRLRQNLEQQFGKGISAVALPKLRPNPNMSIERLEESYRFSIRQKLRGFLDQYFGRYPGDRGAMHRTPPAWGVSRIEAVEIRHDQT